MGIRIMKQPGLGIMRIRRENRRSYQIDWPAYRRAPVIPRLISRPLAGAEHPLIRATPDRATDDEHDKAAANADQHLPPAHAGAVRGQAVRRASRIAFRRF